MKKYIIFGAGHDGQEALSHVGHEKVEFFCDNNPEKVGKEIQGIKIISFEQLIEIHINYTIILAVGYKNFLREQLNKAGIKNYIEYLSDVVIDGFNTIFTHKCDKEFMENDSMSAKLDNLKDKARKIDHFNKFESFRELVKECKTMLNGEYAFYSSRYNETFLYGHGKALMDYAGIDYSNVRKFPLVAHAPIYCGRHPYFNTAAIFSGEYDKEVHNRTYPYVPIFSVGTYINYTEGIYTNEKIKEIKQLNGKTALVFLEHNAEKTISIFKYNDEYLFNDIVNNVTKKYNKVIVCAYWCDYDREIYKRLHDCGIQIVTAGFRFDENFICRLRTIMDIADDVIVYGYTSAAKYGLSLGKRVFTIDAVEGGSSSNLESYIKVERTYDTVAWNKTCDILLKNSGKKLLEYSKEDYDYLNYHVGFDQLKTPEEIRIIYDVSSDIWENCDFNIMKYPFGVYQTYLDYQWNHEYEKLTVLTQALGRNFWNQ